MAGLTQVDVDRDALRDNVARAARRRARRIARAGGMSCLIPAQALQQRDAMIDGLTLFTAM
jgi:hypothetical protein